MSLRITDGGKRGGLKVVLDGQELRYVGDVTMEFPVADVVRAVIPIIVSSPMEIDVDASVTINVLPIDETFEIVESTFRVADDGTTRRRLEVRKKTKHA